MKGYKLKLLVPILVIILCSSYLFYQSEKGLKLDVDFKGGTQIAIETASPIDTVKLEEVLSKYDANVRSTRGVTGYSTLIEFSSDIDSNDVLAALKESGYDFQNYSVQTTSPVLSASFFKQAKTALFLAFIFIAIVIFAIFKSPILSFYTALCPAFDIVETLALTQFLGMDLSLATFAALLMIVGNSVDDDVMTATRVLKRGDLDKERRFKESFKTSLTVKASSMVALFALYLLSISSVISTIATVLLFGLMFDFMNTWMFNANLLRWHTERKGVA